jgi:hypothetical protein
MVTHWSHYRRTAEEFSTAWKHAHDPRRIIELFQATESRAGIRAA